MSYLFGTDQLGRDVLARQLYGARISLTVAGIATLVNFFIGVFYGGIAGYLGGRVDTLMMRFVEVISTIPLTLYVILIMVVFNSGFYSVIIAIGSVYWVDMARIVRGQILTLKQQDYVAAARTMGASTGRILTRHLLPNSVGPILVALTMLIPSAIFIESFMSFIGLGVTPPEASWGTLTSRGGRNAARLPLPDVLSGSGHQPHHVRLQFPRRRPARRARSEVAHMSAPSSRSRTCAPASSPRAARCRPCVASHSSSTPAKSSALSARAARASRSPACRCSACSRPTARW